MAVHDGLEIVVCPTMLGAEVVLGIHQLDEVVVLLLFVFQHLAHVGAVDGDHQDVLIRLSRQVPVPTG